MGGTIRSTNKNREEIEKVINVIINLCLYQVVFIIISNILVSILADIGLNKHIMDPYTELTGEVMGYIFFIKKYMKNNKHKLKLKNTLHFKGYIFIVMLLIGYTLVYDNTIEIILYKFKKYSWFYDFIGQNIKNPIVLFIGSVIMAPFFEEIVYRGIILDRLLIKYNYKKAIIISALIFGIIHFNFVQLPDAFFSGVILGTIYHKTKSLIPCVVIHFLNNLLYIIMEIYPNTYGEQFDIINLSIGLVILVVLGYVFTKNSKKNYFIAKNY